MSRDWLPASLAIYTLNIQHELMEYLLLTPKIGRRQSVL